MNVIDNFSEDSPGKYLAVFRQKKVPIFQNKVYPSVGEATNAETGEVELVQSLTSGFIFNKSFEPHVMNYDVHYQNEQSNSNIFKNHLDHVLQLIKSFGTDQKKVVEIGCGKGVFFEKMLRAGINCWGFDPTYEGKNERIRKEYFDENQKGVNADIIIMRHTLEHITKPFSFLHTIAKVNDYKGKLFIEVPTFDWIVQKNAFWDIFYEHCNYFTEQSLRVMFQNSVTGNFFGGQYIYLYADLNDLRTTIPPGSHFTKEDSLTFSNNMAKYRDLINSSGSIAIWGAGAKGSTFLNLLDKERKIVKYVIDINPAKQDRFIAGSGHPIYNFEALLKDPVKDILVMNENYKEEIKELARQFNINANIISL
jgi:Methyltransferase domain/C-methyltransferase C-terminal domain